MLKIRFKDDRASAQTLEAPGKTIGRSSANDIVIDEEGVYAFHADLRVEAETITITDVNGTSGCGIVVNGVRIGPATPTPLHAGDIITIAGVDLEIGEVNAADSGAKTLHLSARALLPVNAGCWALMVDSGPETGQLVPVTERTEIGRALACDISILEPAVSRRHAELIPQGPDLLLRDLDSANGSFVNGERVDVANLRDQDLLQFGKARFIVRAP